MCTVKLELNFIRSYMLVIFWMQDYYPERLGKLFIVNAPYIFMKVWKIIYPFIDNKTKKKVMFQIQFVSECMIYNVRGKYLESWF